MSVVILFLVLIFFELLTVLVGGFLAWQRVAVFLKWNTNYQAAEYQKTVTHPKTPAPAPAVSLKTTDRSGRAVAEREQLIDLTELPFDQAYEALQKLGEN